MNTLNRNEIAELSDESLIERGMDVNPIEHRREDKNLYPERDVVRFSGGSLM